MPSYGRPARRVAFGAVILGSLGVLASAAGIQRESSTPRFHVSTGRIVVNCPLTVGGSFDAVTESLSGTLTIADGRPGVVDGELTVPLDTIDTGIGLRNRHLRERYLEVARGDRYAQATLTDIVLEDAADAAFTGWTPFAGMLTLHGVTRAIQGDANIGSHAEGRRVEASFSVSLSAFDIPPPRYLGVGVRDEVAIQVEFVAASSPELERP